MSGPSLVKALADDEVVTVETKVIRSHSLRLYTPGSYSIEELAALPIYTDLEYRNSKAPVARFAITRLWAEHIWNGRSWHTRTGATGVRLNKDGSASQRGYSVEKGISFYNMGGVPAEVSEWWASHPTPTTILKVEEV